ncbi:ABC transporter permease [Deinococcus yavapaiensis]|uniref:Transport permease protein n=1 Tax=Deinococcus yavapaiensis KR-236 TaxID=694435 RepID=A0A318S3R2_9DEIO|nr:ABC transporter permease [Deinococcus yavapaiensis]PYE51087.1 ABC-2 type transport system permease protein [Deinococcus yavapaiensis KR-236]
MTTFFPFSPDTRRALAPLPRLVLAEFHKLLRVPMFTMSTILFPILFFAMFGLPNVKFSLDGVGAGPYMVVSYAAYSLMSVALLSFGVSVAAERGMGWTRLLRVSPMPPALYFVAKILTAMSMGLASMLCLVTFAHFAGGVTIAPDVLALVLAKLLAGMIPFVALGLLIGYLASPSSAAPIANLVFLPLSFMSGLFIPVSQGPQVLRDLAPFMPAYHFAQLGWGTIGTKTSGTPSEHWLWLLGYTIVFFSLALWAYRRDEGRKFN